MTYVVTHCLRLSLQEREIEYEYFVISLLLRETSATSGLGFADCGLERETSATSGLGFAICGLERETSATSGLGFAICGLGFKV